MTSRFDSAAGFTLIDVMLVVGFLAVLGAMAVPGLQNFSAAIAVGQAQQMVESELQQARLKAVTTNRNIRVRFNCPAAGQFRMVELIGTPEAPAAADMNGNRCTLTSYPYPAGDRNALTLPNHDGPLRRLDPRVSFSGAPRGIEFRPNGTAFIVNADDTSSLFPAADGTASIIVSKGMSATAVTKTVTVNRLGKIEGIQ